MGTVNGLWHSLRKEMLTSSNFGKIIKRKGNNEQLLYTNFSSKKQLILWEKMGKMQSMLIKRK